MNVTEIIRLDDRQLERYKNLNERYKKMYLEPDASIPMFIINTPVETHRWEEKLFDAEKMFTDELRGIKAHTDIEDDKVPAARVNFGTAQMAAAFGCEMYIPPDNLPCAKNHILYDINDAYKLLRPDKYAGWYKKLYEFSEYYRENLPEGIEIQLPDTQGPFNNAHLIRGNDIIFDFYDYPSKLEYFLDYITDYLINLIKELTLLTTNRDGWFFDWGCLWKGAGRISNCTAHLISPDMYKTFILPRDMRFLESIGGGRIHYCGSYPEVIESFINMPAMTGFDYDDSLHSLYNICKIAPENIPIYCWTHSESNTMKKLLNGEWPEKRNIIIGTNAPSVHEGKILLKKLRESAGRNYL